jgi:hypothetical protein
VRRIGLGPELRAMVRPVLGVRAHDHPLFRGMRRELREEMIFPAGATVHYLGAINEESTAVDRVHLGLAFLLSVPARPTIARAARRRRSRRGPRAIAFRSRPGRRRPGVRLRREPGSLQVGGLFTMSEIAAYQQAMENWSRRLLLARLLPERRQAAADSQ